MGKVKTVIMGDTEAEEKSRRSGKAKREAKKQAKRTGSVVKGLEKAKVEEVLAPETSDTDQKSKVPEKPVKRKASKTDSKYQFSRGKKYNDVVILVDKNKKYSSTEAIELVKKTSYSKFDGSVEVHINVADKNLRGLVTLPHGTGKETRVKIADDTLITSIEKGSKIDFDILVASPDMMPKLARIAKILGPKGLMPNPKTGTIGPNPEKLAKDLSGNQIQWKTEANAPIIHALIGKVSFKTEELEANLSTLTKSIGKDKISSIFLKATMGPSVRVQI